MKRTLLWLVPLFYCVGWLSIPAVGHSKMNRGACANNTTFKVGRGVYDITGPAAESQMMGYADGKQISKGIHMRLRSRAFVIESPCNKKRVVFVSVDLAQMFHSVRWGVIQKLKKRYKNLYSYNNVMISAIHTHQGIAGYSFCALFNMTGLTTGGLFKFKQGFDKENYNAIVNGVFQSIVNAHNNLRSAKIKMASGNVMGASFNRSLPAYLNNPQAERKRYRYNTDKQMTLIRFDAGSKPLGLINWFAVHSTSYSNKHRHVNGDSKGLASYWFEKKHNTKYNSKDTFVAAFAQANCGDVSPNVWLKRGDARRGILKGLPSGKDDEQRADFIATRQYNVATKLFQQAQTKLKGGVDYRHFFVDFSSVNVRPKFTGKGAKKTCRAAFGISFSAGSTEDGPSYHKVGGKLVKEGWTMGRKRRDATFPATKALIKCHAEKDIYLPIGNKNYMGNKYPMSHKVLPLQLFVVGQLAIAAVPFELTTMTGRRLRKVILASLASEKVREVVIAGLSNDYSNYITTREEYAKQHYEGGSTLFGPWTEAALRQSFDTLARSLKKGTPVAMGSLPIDLSKKQIYKPLKVILDAPPLGKKFGDVKSEPKGGYKRGDTVTVKFWGAHLRNHFMTQRSYLEVQRKLRNRWVTVAHDWDPSTRISWKRRGIAASVIKVEWVIPKDAGKGVYRIRHTGHSKKLGGKLSKYKGTSRTFGVETTIQHSKKPTWLNGKCPKGTFRDSKLKCRKCPSGYRRSIQSLVGKKACYKDEWKRAIYVHKKKVFKRCRKGTFFDLYKSGCYRCPKSMKRTIHHIKTSKACHVRRWTKAAVVGSAKAN